MTDTPNNTWPVSAASHDALADYAALIGVDLSVEWQMENSEKLALLALLERLQPECAIEIGSRFGGSMQMFSTHAKRVFSCDIDPTCKERLGAKYPNVEFIAGPSQETLPPLLKRLEHESARLSIMLVDGDHSAAGVQGDIHAMAGYRPACPLYIVLHDSFNPEVRGGIASAHWSDNPYVHSVELDFVPGVLHCEGRAIRQMWGGFALAVLRPEKRTFPLTISASRDYLYQNVLRRSVHWYLDPPTLAKRSVKKLGRLVGLKL
jgi:Cephalosporin hydroxylase